MISPRACSIPTVRAADSPNIPPRRNQDDLLVGRFLDLPQIGQDRLLAVVDDKDELGSTPQLRNLSGVVREEALQVPVTLDHRDHHRDLRLRS